MGQAPSLPHAPRPQGAPIAPFNRFFSQEIRPAKHLRWSQMDTYCGSIANAFVPSDTPAANPVTSIAQKFPTTFQAGYHFFLSVRMLHHHRRNGKGCASEPGAENLIHNSLQMGRLCFPIHALWGTHAPASKCQAGTFRF